METYINKEALVYEKAMKRVQEIKKFYKNLVSYCLVIPFLAILNSITSPGYLWFFWAMLGWGMGLVAHGINTFGIGKDWEDKKINQLMAIERKNSKSL